MKNMGFIGFGSMGSMLVEALLRNDVVEERRLVLFSRSPEKFASFSSRHPNVAIAGSIEELVRMVGYVFVCVPPANVKEVLHEIRAAKDSDCVVVSLAASVSLDCLSSVVGEQVSRIIPNITAEVDEGVFLACHGEFLDPGSSAFIERILSYVGTVYVVPENQIEVYTDITSCSPGFFSKVFEVFLESAKRTTAVDPDLALGMFLDTIQGLARLYKERDLDFEGTIRRVARKGGVTEVGVQVIAEKLPEVFDEVFAKTLENHRVKKAKMEGSYGLASPSTSGDKTPVQHK